MAGITRLYLTHFRSYPELEFLCDHRPVILTGKNGAGKTNLLEAISLLSPGRGMRRASLGEMIHENGGTASSLWGVAATLYPENGDEMPYVVGTGNKPTGEGRSVKVNGEALKSQNALSHYLNVTWVTPAMDRLFQEGASERRRFFDRLVFGFQVSHAQNLTRYDYFMRERLRILGGAIAFDASWLKTLESKMATEGVRIASARRACIDELKSSLCYAMGDFPKGRLEWVSDLKDLLTRNDEQDAIFAFQEELKERRRVDQESHRTTYGIHRDDFEVFYLEKNRLAGQSSTGEQKALLLSIVMAAIRRQNSLCSVPSILLLDEVVAHLDEQRRQALFEEILALNLQTWMTGTDADLFEPLGEKVQHFYIKSGIVLPL